MTESDLPVSLGAVGEGDTLKVEYRSRRSGNPVERKGEVDSIRPAGDGSAVYVFNESRGELTNTYVVLHEAETTDGDDAIAAYSLTAGPKLLGVDGRPEVGKTYTYQQVTKRTSLLGLVLDLRREDRGGLWQPVGGGS